MPIVYSYDARILSGLSIVSDQMHAAHKYRNKLCEIERTRRAAVDAVLAELSPRLVEVDARLVVLDDSIESIAAGLRKINAAAKKKVSADKEAKASLAALRAERKVLYAERKALRTELFGISERAEKIRKAACDLQW